MILVTGCSGFIGFHLCKVLSKKNKVLGLDNINNYYSPKLKKQRLEILRKSNNFKFKKIDLNNFAKVNNFLKKYKIQKIVHLAAQPGVRISIKYPLNTLNQNLLPFINIMEIARIKKVKKFVFASSSSVYGETVNYPFNENDKEIKPVSVYGATKYANEILAKSYSKNFKLNCIGLRFFTVYGPFGRPDMAYYIFLENLKKNKTIKVFNKGKMLRDFTYIDDVVNGIIRVLQTKFKTKYEIINIGKGRPNKLMELVNNLENDFKKKFKIDFTKNIPLGDVKKTYSNISKAKKLINWNLFTPKFQKMISSLFSSYFEII